MRTSRPIPFFCPLQRHPITLLYNPGLVDVVHRERQTSSRPPPPELGGRGMCANQAMRTGDRPGQSGLISPGSICHRTTVTPYPISNSPEIVRMDRKGLIQQKQKHCMPDVAHRVRGGRWLKAMRPSQLRLRSQRSTRQRPLFATTPILESKALHCSAQNGPKGHNPTKRLPLRVPACSRMISDVCNSPLRQMYP